VRGDGQQIAGELAEPDGEIAEGLDRIGVERDTRGPAAAADLGDRLDHPGLVVHPHHGDHYGPSRQGGVECDEIDHAVPAHRKDLFASARCATACAPASTALCSTAETATRIGAPDPAQRAPRR